MEPGIFGWLFFALFAVSTPVYVLVLATIIRFRHEQQFRSSFFTIALSIGAFDLLHLVPGWLTGRFANFAWYGVHQFVLRNPAFWAKFDSVMWWFAGLGQTLGVPLLAAARMFSIAYKRDVTPSTLRALLVGHWVIPAVLTLPQLWCDFKYIQSNDTADEGVLMNWVQYDYKNYYFTGCIWWCVVMGVASAVCVAVTVRSIYVAKATIQHYMSVSANNRMVEIKLAIVGFILFVLTAVYGVYCGVEARVEGKAAQMFMLRLQFILGDIYSWINVYLLLLCSGEVRKHIRKMLGCEKPRTAKVAALSIAQVEKSHFSRSHLLRRTS